MLRVGSPERLARPTWLSKLGVRASDVPPEIHQVHLNTILQSRLPDPLLSEDLLLRTQSQRVHRAPRQPDRLDGHASPSAANLQYAMSAPDLGFPDDMVQLGILSRLERIGGGVRRFRGVRVGLVDRVEFVGLERGGEVAIERREDGTRVGHLATSILVSIFEVRRPGPKPKSSATHIGAQKARKHPITNVVVRPDIPHTVPHAIHHARIRRVVPDRGKDCSRQRVETASDPP